MRILFATLALGCASDADPSVRAAAVRTIGFAVTFNTLNDASFSKASYNKYKSLINFIKLCRMLHFCWIPQSKSFYCFVTAMCLFHWMQAGLWVILPILWRKTSKFLFILTWKLCMYLISFIYLEIHFWMNCREIFY